LKGLKIMKFIDLRSDTVTRPSGVMRKAMAEAEVGDDVMGEDPTVNRLQQVASSLVGKEAGLYLASGTMGNLVAILTHCNRGDEIILGRNSHTYLNEAGGISALGGIHPFPIANNPDGTLSLDEVQRSIRHNDNPHHPNTKLVTIENTHNDCGGIALEAQYTNDLVDLAHHNGLQVHLDGARIFNAAVKLNVPVTALTAPIDSVQFCLSKGLGAPVGSILCGSEEFIYRALRIRKQLGGGMRQAGIIAAAGLVSLEKMVDRLKDDHDRAERLAVELGELPSININWHKNATNMVFLTLDADSPFDAYTLENSLRNKGILIDVKNEHRIRLVVHCDLSENDIDETIRCFNQLY
jgi:threonine aldolase